MKEAKPEKRREEPVIAVNRRAGHDYHLFERLEAGIALTGTEVKGLREHQANLREAYAEIHNGEAWLRQCHISEYSHGNRHNHEPLRSRRLLLHRREIRRLEGRTVREGFTLVPTRLYFKKGKVKVELAVARGKKDYDKRQDLIRAADRREMDRAARGKTDR